MKKTVLSLALIVSALICSADYLKWQIGDTGSYSSQYAYAAVYATKNTDGKSMASDSMLSMYTTDGNSIKYVEAGSTTSAYAVNTAGYTGADYSYYIALLDSNLAEVAYSQLLSSSSTPSLSTSLSDVPTATDTWIGTAYSAPEPSSALLLLLGLAGLGLKRKNA